MFPHHSERASACRVAKGDRPTNQTQQTIIQRLLEVYLREQGAV